MILVTGIERSGAGMVAKTLEQSGVYFGRCNGRMENETISHLFRNYAKSNYSDPIGQWPLPNVYYTGYQLNTNLLKEQIVGELKYTGKQGIKSFHLFQNWEMVNEIFPSAKWIIVRRNKQEVLSSCLSTAYMNAFDLEVNRLDIGAKTTREAWSKWIDLQTNMLDELVNLIPEKVMEIWPERMKEDHSDFITLLNWLDLPVNETVINEQLIKKLR